MNPRLLVISFTLLGGLCCPAQNPPRAAAIPTTPDPVTDAVAKFFANRPGDSPPNEVTVTLPPQPAQPDPAPSAPAPSAPTPPIATGPGPAPADAAAPPTPAEPEPSLTVQVEKLQTGSGAIDPKTVKLRAPFPAKPLAATPPGWRLEASNNAPPFIRKVELAPGTSITLTIRPHLLVPEAASFAITEPGFEHALGYRQAQTVSAILSHSIQQLDEDAKQLGNAIDHLQQLVSSLPHPEPTPQPAPAPTLKPSSKR